MALDRTNLLTLFRSRLSWRIALSVFLAIVFIEIVILVPSYDRREDALLMELETLGRTAVAAASTQVEHGVPATSSAIISRVMAIPRITDVSIIEPDGAYVSVGVEEAETFRMLSAAETIRARSPDGDAYDVAWHMPEAQASVARTVYLRINSSSVAPDLRDYVKRIAGLVVLISVFVTVVTLGVLWPIVLRPLHVLSQKLSQAENNQSSPQLTAAALARTDEIGHLNRAISSMIDRVSSSIMQIEDANARLEVEVLKRTADLQKANDDLARQINISQTAEDRFRSFASAAADWYWEMDKDLRFSYFSNTFLAVTGVKPDDLLGRTREETGIPNMEEAAWAAHLDDLRRHQPFRDFVHPRDKGGKTVWLSINGQPQFDEQGAFQGYRGTGSDVTVLKENELDLLDTQKKLENSIVEIKESRRRVEEEARKHAALSVELADARDQAEAASKAKSEFLAAMSHEIRTPMTGVMGFADMMLSDDLPEKNRVQVFKIKDAARSLLAILNDVLDVSKMEAGKIDLEYLDTHLPSLIGDVLELFREKRSGQRARNLELSVELDDDFPVGVNCEPTRLRQILVNLVGNAVKFTEKGGVTVVGRLEGADTDTPQIFISVRDTGIGIKQESLDGLFVEFTQADSTIARRFEGTGLGLSICKKLVSLMGGEIGVESTYGEGSEFWFKLPYVAAVEDVSASPGTVATPTHFAAHRPLHILIVDDNQLNQQIIFSMMIGFGHTAQIAENGMKAIEMHERGDYDLILMDVRMPVMSGPAATKLIRQMEDDKESVPIVALTADAMEEHKQEFLEAGMNAVVTKPISRAELALTINDVMGDEVHVSVEATEEDDAGDEDQPDAEEVKVAVDDFLKQIGAASGGD